MLGSIISDSAGWWYESKLFIEHALAVSHDSLHVLTGVMLQLAVALAFSRTLASWLPWLAVLGFALTNEAVDLWVERWPNPSMQFGEGVKDIVLTILLPTLLLVAVRVRPDLFPTRAPRR